MFSALENYVFYTAATGKQTKMAAGGDGVEDSFLSRDVILVGMMTLKTE